MFLIYLFITRQYLRAIICDVFVNCLLLFGVYILFFNRFKLQFGIVVICYIQFRYWKYEFSVFYALKCILTVVCVLTAVAGRILGAAVFLMM